MSEFKITGMCTICDAECYEIISLWKAHEHRPGEPKSVGRVLDHAVKVTFMLMDGTLADLTFCAMCASACDLDKYTEIWRKVMRSWIREQNGGDHSSWMPQQFSNGLLYEIGRVTGKELNG